MNLSILQSELNPFVSIHLKLTKKNLYDNI